MTLFFFNHLLLGLVSKCSEIGVEGLDIGVSEGTQFSLTEASLFSSHYLVSSRGAKGPSLLCKQLASSVSLDAWWRRGICF